jgi:hypothetical protein
MRIAPARAALFSLVVSLAAFATLTGACDSSGQHSLDGSAIDGGHDAAMTPDGRDAPVVSDAQAVSDTPAVFDAPDAPAVPDGGPDGAGLDLGTAAVICSAPLFPPLPDASTDVHADAGPAVSICGECQEMCAMASCDDLPENDRPRCRALLGCVSTWCLNATGVDTMRCYCDLADAATCQTSGAVGRCRPEFEAAAGTTDPAQVIAAFTTAPPVTVALKLAACTVTSCSGVVRPPCVPTIRGSNDPGICALPRSPAAPGADGGPPACPAGGQGPFVWTEALSIGNNRPGLWSAGPNDTWMLSSDGFRHWDGTRWTGALPPWGCAALPLWGSSPNDLWFAAGALERWDGRSLKTMLSVYVSSVWGTGPGDVWAFGDGRLFRWNGTAWSERTPLANERVFRYVVGGAAPNDLWVFADRNQIVDERPIFRWNGTALTRLANLEPTLGAVSVVGVWGAAPDDVWLLGSRGVRRGGWLGFVNHEIWHFDGAAWTLIKTLPWSGSARGITGSSRNDVWIWTEGGLVEHFDGTTWSRADTGAFTLGSLVLESPGVIWAAGEVGGYIEPGTSKLLHRHRACAGADGGVASTGVVSAGGFDFTPEPVATTGLWAFGANEVWRSTEADVERWDGQSWKTMLTNAACEPDMRRPFGEIWGSSPNDVWIGGHHLQHWDGQRWQDRAPEPAPGNELEIAAIWGSAPNDVWVIRRNRNVQQGPAPPLRWDGRSWTAHPIPPVTIPGESAAASVVVGDLWGSGPADLWAFGYVSTPPPGGSGAYRLVGVFAHWNGSAWTVAGNLADPAVQDHLIQAGWGSSSRDVWAVSSPGVGRAGKVWRYDGSTWRVAGDLPVIGLPAVWGSGPNDVWLGGERALRHFDGTSFTDLDLNALRYRMGVSIGPDEIRVGAEYHSRGGVLFRGVRALRR